MSTNSRLVKLNFKPGINRESTEYAEEGSWFNADKVRFRQGRPENLRGYKFARVSPRRTLSNGEFVRIGGNKYIYSTLEYLYPLALETGLKGILFFVSIKSSTV